jgi:hypothetical protein
VRQKFRDHSVQLIPLILSADGTAVSLKISVKPVYVSLGIHPLKTRSSQSARACIGFVPNTNAVQAQGKRCTSGQVKRITTTKSWRVIMEELRMSELLT